MKYFTIGSSPADYSTLATFYAGTYPAILTDVDAPYVALLKAETHTFPDTMSAIDTDSSHYYIFQPLGKYWQGEEDTTGCVILSGTGNNTIPYYSKVYGCVFTSSIITDNNLSVIAGDNCGVFNCLFIDYSINRTNTKSTTITFGKDSVNFNFFNCVWNNITMTSTSSKGLNINVGGNLYNCVMKNIIMNAVGTKVVRPFGNVYNAFFDSGHTHNLTSVGTLKNCAFMSGVFSGGTPDSSNFYPYNDATHFAVGGYYASPTCPLKGSGMYPEVNFGSINGVEYWPYEWNDVGPLYFKKNVLLFRQNNQNLIFQTI